MTTEQKAKAYDEAIKRARAFELPEYNNIMESVFPELQESENESIKKDLLGWFEEFPDMIWRGHYKKDVLAWIEKQGEQKPIDYNEELKKCRENPLYFFDKYVSVKLKNQKPDWSEDDERIRKGLIKAVSGILKGNTLYGTDVTREEALAWLEKQGEQKPANKVKPKFKVKDWIANGGANPCYVKSIFGDYYELCSCEGFEYTKPIIDVNYTYHLWNIEDARDGNVVVDKSDGTIGIFKSIGNHPDGGSCNDPSYCFLYCRYDDGFFYADFENGNTINSNDLIPATKEQQDLFFEEVGNAGYEWDADKKELSKQTLKIMPKFCIGQLITDDNDAWYQITNIKCLNDWYYEVYDICEGETHLELCSIIDEKFRENRFVSEIKKMIRD